MGVGMTWLYAGMTELGVGITWLCAGMTGVGQRPLPRRLAICAAADGRRMKKTLDNPLHSVIMTPLKPPMVI